MKTFDNYLWEEYLSKAECYFNAIKQYQLGESTEDRIRVGMKIHILFKTMLQPMAKAQQYDWTNLLPHWLVEYWRLLKKPNVVYEDILWDFENNKWVKA